MRIILPKTFCELDPKYGKLFFLAGPEQGGGGWQIECVRELRKHTPYFYAAIPCRYSGTHPLMSFQVRGKDDHFDRQLTWERYYLEIAATEGCIIFWLPRESKMHPKFGPDPYAMDTRGELGEWRGRMMHNKNLRVVVGAEVGFPGLSQIERNFRLALNTDFPIYRSLRETVAAAITKAQ